jgi:hypothetical protein
VERYERAPRTGKPLRLRYGSTSLHFGHFERLRGHQ